MRRTTTAIGAQRETASTLTKEHQRLLEHRAGQHNWKQWGPYVSDRAWGTVREDYSADGSAWDYLPHDKARSKAYRWGEDGIAGICDDQQTLCFAVAVWNGKDPILKERYFGLTGPQGNHGEDVKELYYYLDATPTHSYLKMLYKYPQAAFPYDKLVEVNGRRGGFDPEYELLDTGVMNDGKYWDIFVEYAKAGPQEMCIRITAVNRGAAAATIHLLPHLWFRNDWSWGAQRLEAPLIEFDPANSPGGWVTLLCTHKNLGQRFLYTDGASNPSLLFTDNETNRPRVYGDANAQPYVKDAFHDYVVGRKTDAVNLQNRGTKACGWDQKSVEAGGELFDSAGAERCGVERSIWSV